jgi:hypothetical protein
LLAAGTTTAAVHQAGATPLAVAKKKCKIVKKKVHGRVRKVRVCKKVKPKPTPTPSLPASVSVTLDSAHAATASIGAADGGTLSAGGATLTVPAGAVAGATTVTMTPVAQVGGLRGHVLAAVQFAPDGLQFQKPVTLTIPVSSTNAVQGFTYGANGSGFHLYPVTVQDGKATFELVHLSGYGIGEELPPPAVDRLRKYLNTEVKPAVEKATHDSRYFVLAVIAADQFVLELVDLPSAEFRDFYPELKALLSDVAVALRLFADDQHLKCVELHEIVETAKELRYTSAFLLILLALNVQELTDAWSYAREQVTKCESFELDFNSEITWTSGPGHTPGTRTLRVRVIGLKLNAANAWSNQSPLDYWSFNFPAVANCSISSVLSTERPFTAKLTGVDAWPDGGSPPQISMNVNIGRAREDTTLNCPGNSGPIVQHEYLWSLGMGTRHGGEAWTIADWTYIGHSVFAQRTYRGSSVVAGDTATEQTTFTLRHTPE